MTTEQTVSNTSQGLVRSLIHRLCADWTPFSLFMAVILCSLYLTFFGFRALVQVEVSLKSPHPSFFKLYWADEEGLYSEKNMRQIRLTHKKDQYRVFLTNLSAVKRLRIDPIEYAGAVELKGLQLTQLGYQPVRLQSKDQFEGLKILKQAELKVNSQGSLDISTLGKDAQIEYLVTPQRTSFLPLVHLINVFIIVLLVRFSRNSCARLLQDYRFIPALVLVITLLTLIMASITTTGVHPDEKVHLSAVTYYANHWLPPALDSPDIADSYSGYGFSRLGNFEIYYPLAGYFSRLLQPLHLSEWMQARLFGVVLLGILLIAALRRSQFRIFLLPLLVSAQTWYLFSYSNSDGFALFVALIASYQAAYPHSMLNRLLTDTQEPYAAMKMGLFGVLVGILLLAKTNFYFFLMFLGAYFLWRILCGEFADKKLFWTRVILISAVGASIYAGRVGLDYAVNGPDPSALRNEMTELHAEPLYKPSTPMNQKHIYLYLKDRGFSLDRIINKEQWPGKTFVNAFGSYGHTEYLGSSAFFNAVKNIGILTLAVMLVGVLIRGGPSLHGLTLIVLGCAVALILMLLWRSWAISFQAQGRYLAPILPMLGILYYHVRSQLSERLMVCLILAMFFLGFYSFVFVGLHDIPKLDFSML